MPKQLLRRVTRYFGRRGGVLTLFGFCWMVIGLGYALIKMERFSRAGTGGPLEFMDSTPLPGSFWIVCGLIAFINGLVRRRIGNDDAIGYAVLIMPPMFWMLAYAWSFVLWVITHDDMLEPYGRQSGFLGVAVFGIIVIIIRIVANWKDDLDVTVELEKTPGTRADTAIKSVLNDAERDRANNGGHDQE